MNRPPDMLPPLCRDIAPSHKLEHTVEVAKNKNSSYGSYGDDNGDVNLGSAGERRAWGRRGLILATRRWGARIGIWLIYPCKCKHRCNADYDCPKVCTSLKLVWYNISRPIFTHHVREVSGQARHNQKSSEARLVGSIDARTHLIALSEEPSSPSIDRKMLAQSPPASEREKTKIAAIRRYI